MANILIPIAVSSQLDSSGEERIHAAGYTIGNRSILPLRLVGVMGAGSLGAAVEGAYVAHGGIPPYTFSLSSGALPTGVSLSSDGTYSGSFAASGNFSWTIRVTDAIGTVVLLADSNQVTVSLWLATNANSARNTGNADLLISDDLVNWELHSRVPNLAPNLNGGPMAVGNGNIILSSTGSSIELFSDLSNTVIPVTTLSGIVDNDEAGFSVFDNYNYIVSRGGHTAAGNTNTHLSTDHGVTWHNYAKPGGLIPYPANVWRLGNGRWVCPGVGNFGGFTSMYYTDNTFPTGWTKVNLTNFSKVNRAFYATIGNDNAVCCVTNQGQIVRTINGTSWQSVTTSLGSQTDMGRGQIVIGDVFIIQYDQTRSYLRSDDAGLTWSKLAISTTGNFTIQGFAYGNGILVAYVSGGGLWKSTDLGLTWSSFTLPGNRGAPTIGFAEVVL